MPSCGSSEDEGSTTISYDADAVVGGMIGGVGQRMLAGVARKTAGEFFAAVERELVHGPVSAPAPMAAPPLEAEGLPARVGPQLGQVFPGAAPAARDERRGRRPRRRRVVGAIIALAGVAGRAAAGPVSVDLLADATVAGARGDRGRDRRGERTCVEVVGVASNASRRWRTTCTRGPSSTPNWPWPCGGSSTGSRSRSEDPCTGYRWG
jgi:hypothetical protein